MTLVNLIRRHEIKEWQWLMAAIHLQIFLENSSLAWQSWRSSPAHLELTSHGVPTTTCRTVFPPAPARTHLGCDFLKKYPGEAPRNLVLFGHVEREALPANPSVWKAGGEKKKGRNHILGLQMPGCLWASCWQCRLVTSQVPSSPCTAASPPLSGDVCVYASVRGSATSSRSEPRPLQQPGLASQLDI